MTLVENEYNYNSNFRKYVDEYCKSNNCTLENALKNEQIKRIFLKYTEV